MSNIQITLQQLEEIQPLEIVEHPLVRDKFIQIYDTLWGEGWGAQAYTRESVYFNRILRDADGGKLQKATKFSIFTAFIDLAVCGLSLEPGTRALCYLMGRNTNLGTKDAPKWEGRCVLTISGYGELVLRARAGQIRHADNPVIVYEGDEFSFSDRGGVKSVDYTLNIKHNIAKPIACFLRITRADGSIDYAVLLEEDWQRLAGYSGKANKKFDQNTRRYVEMPNALYTSGEGNRIDSGFLMAKCIKHAFRSYPKVRIGHNTELQSQEPLPGEELDYYGIDEPTDNRPAMSQPESFAPPTDTSAGVVISDDDPENGF